MSGMLKSVKDGGAGLMGEIEFTGRIGSDIVTDDSVNLRAERLDRNWESLSADGDQWEIRLPQRGKYRIATSVLLEHWRLRRTRRHSWSSW